MGGAGFAALFGSSPIILIQTQEMIVPDTGNVTVSGQPLVPLEKETPTFQFVLMLRSTLTFKTGM